ncbi:GNAT family N-acetyltransferase [Luteibacter sp.]|jgi:RimJ/RimL family protein N-acetyltransferase|uniref:GNAT family N-acetyltransferase n=1 Tax=Luteibacter sp. TaxID=1886636 RepID=UPI002F4026B1
MIETDRLILSTPAIADFDAYHALFSEPPVYRFFGNTPLTRNESWTKFLRGIGHWSVFGFGMFSIREKTTRRYLGETGLVHFQRELGPDFDSCAEAVWILTSDAHGKGYATEAAEAALRWIFDTKGEQRSVCLIDPENTGSTRVAEKLGYRMLEPRTYREKPVTILERMPDREHLT